MRLPCPHCGERGHEEFAYFGDATKQRPAAAAPPEAWNEFVHLRDNPFGPHRELWHHIHGCRRWLVITRDTRNHAIQAAYDAARGAA